MTLALVLRGPWCQLDLICSKLAGATGFEPAASCVTGRRLSGVKHSFRSATIRFPDLVWLIPAAVGAVGKVGIPRVLRDFRGRWEGRKTCLWFSSLSITRLFNSPSVAVFLLLGETSIVT